ncbi:hypothetical protein OB2597_09429 [Pseudooceanicola batsensis HTCC2597]|uniref:Methyltransferase n=1 Tax=Pseudooceanicola batsensis (strain ATCC BAA-863 / DSM 15984 / KCTC 12145 / HTCC2597) TaxID=252305 RepID=A3TV08_PSEBH|nr:DUF938 domain-containing protein [Pseudooceanicola batsensis]EAQ04354.1 hypothetical protein OB2597_09429 [Pseudooceanicola batsensis HTCC2597]
MTQRNLPPSASVAEKGDGAKLVIPAADRNGAAIENLIAQVIEDRDISSALEIASGSGQHILRHARRHPHIQWQPTEIDPDRLASIEAYAAEAGEENILPPRVLNAVLHGWADQFDRQDLVILVNLLHLVSHEDANVIFRETARLLPVGGLFVAYGPFMRGGELTSEGDRTFHADLTASDPEIGYKDDAEITEMLHVNGMTLIDLIEMPANNLAFVAERD